MVKYGAQQIAGKMMIILMFTIRKKVRIVGILPKSGAQHIPGAMRNKMGSKANIRSNLCGGYGGKNFYQLKNKIMLNVNFRRYTQIWRPT